MRPGARPQLRRRSGLQVGVTAALGTRTQGTAGRSASRPTVKVGFEGRSSDSRDRRKPTLASHRATSPARTLGHVHRAAAILRVVVTDEGLAVSGRRVLTDVSSAVAPQTDRSYDRAAAEVATITDSVHFAGHQLSRDWVEGPRVLTWSNQGIAPLVPHGAGGDPFSQANDQSIRTTLTCSLPRRIVALVTRTRT